MTDADLIGILDDDDPRRAERYAAIVGRSCHGWWMTCPLRRSRRSSLRR
jgi:hypothetical protein